MGKLDENGCLWFYGRKSHKVETAERTLFSIPCEAVFNKHPGVFRSALVGIREEKNKYQIPVLCVQLEKNKTKKFKNKLLQELLVLGSNNPVTKGIKIILISVSIVYIEFI